MKKKTLQLKRTCTKTTGWECVGWWNVWGILNVIIIMWKIAFTIWNKQESVYQCTVVGFFFPPVMNAKYEHQVCTCYLLKDYKNVHNSLFVICHPLWTLNKKKYKLLHESMSTLCIINNNKFSHQYVLFLLFAPTIVTANKINNNLSLIKN